eukprot:scaffold8690_cov190-Amphora_coffeaeformis.AAC.10
MHSWGPWRTKSGMQCLRSNAQQTEQTTDDRSGRPQVLLPIVGTLVAVWIDDLAQYLFSQTMVPGRYRPDAK